MSVLPMASAGQVMAAVRARADGLWGRLAAAVAAIVVGALADLVIPLGTGRIVDIVRSGQGSISWPAMGMAAAIGVSAVAAGLSQALTPAFCAVVVARLREDMMLAALRADQQLTERAGSAEVVARVSDDVAAVRDAANGALPRLLSTGMAMIAAIGGLALLHPAFLLPVVVAAVVYGLALRSFLRVAPGIFTAERTASAKASQHILSTMNGLPTVRAYGISALRMRAVADGSWQAMRAGMATRLLTNRLVLRLFVGEAAAVLGVLLTGYLLVIEGAISIGGVSAATLMACGVVGPLRFLLTFLEGLQMAAVCLQRIVGMLNLPSAAGADDGYRATGIRPGEVQVADLSFHYANGCRAVQDVSFALEPGQVLAIVGSSGAGKTTLAALLAGLLPAYRGSAVCGGAVVLVSQHPHVFSGTLRDDLSLGARQAVTDDQLRALIDKVGAGWVADLADGLDTQVGRDGLRLSACQAQQIALVRALLAEPDVLILDEATAEAGSSGAAMLDSSAGAVLAGRTAIVVAHRLSQTEMADWVMVMDHGRIVETGRRSDLIAADGPFARLWQAWRTGRIS